MLEEVMRIIAWRVGRDWRAQDDQRRGGGKVPFAAFRRRGHQSRSSIAKAFEAFANMDHKNIKAVSETQRLNLFDFRGNCI